MVAAAVGRDLKGKLSPGFYVAGIGLSFLSTRLAVAVFAAVGLMWLIPDRRIERGLRAARPGEPGDE